MVVKVLKNNLCEVLEEQGFNLSEFDGGRLYDIPNDIGNGHIWFYCDDSRYFIVKGEYFLNSALKGLFKTEERYAEISLKESGAIQSVKMDINCRMNRGHSYSFNYPAGKSVSFVNVCISQNYLLEYINKRYPNSECDKTKTMAIIKKQLNIPKVYSILGQITIMNTRGKEKKIFLNDKIEELMFYITSDSQEGCSTCNSRVICACQDTMGLCTVESYLKNNLEKSPSIDELAHMSGMSPTKLKQEFKKQYGDTVYGYFRTLRMERAAQMIKEEGLSVMETAYNVGYKSVSRFSEAFSQAYGMLPSQYKIID